MLLTDRPAAALPSSDHLTGTAFGRDPAVLKRRCGSMYEFASPGKPLTPSAGEDSRRLVMVREADLGQRDGGARLTLMVLDRLLSEAGKQHLPVGCSGAKVSSCAR
jgi:hypothetical protein